MSPIEVLLLIGGGLLIVSVPSLREHIGEHLLEIELTPGSAAAGERIIDLRLPPQALLVLISRDGQHVVPTGSTVLREGDHVLITTEQTQVAEQVRQKLV